jgi:hypothetical protein
MVLTPPAADSLLADALFASRSRRAGLATCMALTMVPLLLGPQAARAATYTVSASTWGTSTAVNSFAWALAQANGNLGHDTISITPQGPLEVKPNSVPELVLASPPVPEVP